MRRIGGGSGPGSARGTRSARSAVVSAVLEDGTVVHGRGMLVAADADGDEVVIEGTDGLD